MTTKKLTDYLKQQTPTQSSSKMEQTEPAPIRIRFKKETEFQETPIGKIPKEWKVCRLSELATDMYYGVTAKAVEYNTGIKFLRTTDIKDYKVRWDSLPYCEITSNNKVNISKYVLRKGDIVVSRAGTVGMSIYVENDMPDTVFGSYLIKIRMNEKIINSRFLHYYFQTEQYWRQILSSSKGSTLKNISLPVLERLVTPVPPPREQNAIIEILSMIDSAIEKVRLLIDRAERLKKGLMQELLTKGIGHKEYKETPIGKIPKEWKIVELGKVCDSIKEIVEPKTMNPDTPYVGLEHIESGDFSLTRHGIVGEVVSTKYRFYKGDILYGKLRPYLDKCVIASIDGVCSTDFIVIRAKKNLVLPEYIVAVLHTEKFIKFATSTMKGTNHPRTSWESISKFILPLPPLEEQAKISEILMTVNRYLKALKHRLEQLESIKKGLMEVLLTGKVRVLVESS